MIDLHTRAALEFDEERPGELRAVLRQLVELPLGDRVGDAELAAALTRAEIALERGDTEAAIAELETQDSTLEHPRVRDLYARIVRRGFQHAMGAGDYARAEQAIERASEHVAELVDVSGMRIELARKRNFPRIVAGVVVLVLLSAGGGWLLFRLASRRRARARAREREADGARSLDVDLAPAPEADAQPDPFDEWQTAREVERRTHSPLDDFGAAS